MQGIKRINASMLQCREKKIPFVDSSTKADEMPNLLHFLKTESDPS